MIKKGLAVAFILLFIGMSVAPSSAVQEFKEKSSPVGFDGNTLYVGGTGPNNYTTIQSAINDASEGDTVFVYDDSSPYNESVYVEKIIDLIGEDRNTTVIEGDGINSVVYISVDSVTVEGFTITGCTFGIIIVADGNANIYGNIITGNSWGLFIEDTHENFISYNIITSNDRIGILLRAGCENNIISNNIISYNRDGIIQEGLHQFWHPNKHFTNTHIVNNEITNNNRGVIVGTNGNVVSDNNFIDNAEHAYFYQSLQNEWDANYWDDSQGSPYIIKGNIGFIFGFIPWRDYDYHPAQEPYDI